MTGSVSKRCFSRRHHNNVSSLIKYPTSCPFIQLLTQYGSNSGYYFILWNPSGNGRSHFHPTVGWTPYMEMMYQQMISGSLATSFKAGKGSRVRNPRVEAEQSVLFRTVQRDPPQRIEDALIDS